MKKIWNIHKIMLIILTTILLFACNVDTSNIVVPLKANDIHTIEKNCDSFGGVKIFNIKKITTYKNSSCVRDCEYISYYDIDSVVCNDGVIIKNIMKKFLNL